MHGRSRKEQEGASSAQERSVALLSVNLLSFMEKKLFLKCLTVVGGVFSVLVLSEHVLGCLWPGPGTGWVPGLVTLHNELCRSILH